MHRAIKYFFPSIVKDEAFYSIIDLICEIRRNRRLNITTHDFPLTFAFDKHMSSYFLSPDRKLTSFRAILHDKCLLWNISVRFTKTHKNSSSIEYTYQ